MQKVVQKANPSLDLRLDKTPYSFKAIQIAYALLFAVAYAQAPLFTGNQHTKFLHAAAQAGLGHLHADWTAQTIDPLPAFTWLIYPVFAYLPLGTFHLMLAVLIFVYAYAAVGLAGYLHRDRAKAVVPLELAAIFGALLLLFSIVIISMTRGVANQYMLSHVLQPCVFGVFILYGLYLWLKDYRGWAAACLALAAIFHPGAYLLTSAILLAALLISSRSQLTKTSAAVPIAVFLALVAPLMTYQALSLSPTTPEAFARATDILANIRIPRHTNVALWFDVGAASKFAWMALACVLVRHQRQLFWCMTALTGFAIIASAALWLFPNAGMRFSTPWRVTTISMPLATIIVLYYFSAWISEAVAVRPAWSTHLRRGALIGFSAVSIFLLYKMAHHYIRGVSEPSEAAIAYARQNADAKQLYLVPTGQQEFRMESGLPILVTYKTHPYKDVEVLEWYERVQASGKIYELAGHPDGGAEALKLMDQYGITHALVPASATFAVAPFKEVYADAHFKIVSRSQP